MLKGTIIGILMFFIPICAFAGEYVIQTTVEQDEGLQYVVDLHNAERLKADSNFVPITKEAYVLEKTLSTLNTYVKKKMDDKLKELAAIYVVLPKVDREELEGLLKQKAEEVIVEE